MKNRIKNSVVRALPSVLVLMALLTCASLATSVRAASSSPENAAGRLIGVWDSQVTLTNCQGITVAMFEAFIEFQRGGTLTSVDNTPPTGHGPGLGTWQSLGGGSYSAPFQLFRFNTDGTFAGINRITRTIQLAADRNSYTSVVSVEIFDANGNLIGTACGTEVATRFE